MPTTEDRVIDGLTVVGIGNPLCRDDGVGLTLVRAVSAARPVPGVATCLWENADALTLAQGLLESTGSSLLIVDCADIALEGGNWRLFSEPDAVLRMRSRTLSTHGLGLAEALSIARALGFQRPVHFFGVQPFDLAPVSGLSAAMRRCLPLLLEALREAIHALAPAPGERNRARGPGGSHRGAAGSAQ